MPEISPVPAGLSWRTARTCDGGACVMVARHQDSVVLGNTTQPDGPTLACTGAEWTQFVAGVKLGDFDDLLEII
jgi:Domain of unknown function (DUF397)